MTLFDRERWKAYCEECETAISVTSRGEAEHLMRIHNDGCPNGSAVIEKLDAQEGAK